MIKTWLKHKIYEQAINTFFDQMYANFVMPKLRAHVLYGNVTVKTRRLHANYSLEMQQDIAMIGGQDIENLLLEAILAEMENEIGRISNGVKV